jgi:hypothetical protein
VRCGARLRGDAAARMTVDLTVTFPRAYALELRREVGLDLGDHRAERGLRADRRERRIRLDLPPVGPENSRSVGQIVVVKSMNRREFGRAGPAGRTGREFGASPSSVRH